MKFKILHMESLIYQHLIVRENLITENVKKKKNTSIKILKQNIRYYSYDQSSILDNQHTFSEKKYRVYLHIVYICIMRGSFFSLMFINLTIHEVTA